MFNIFKKTHTNIIIGEKNPKWNINEQMYLTVFEMTNVNTLERARGKIINPR